MPAPTPIPLPEHFPITWDHPDQAALPWAQDRMHAPKPMTPLSHWFANNGFRLGANKAVSAYNAPVAFHCGHFNYYYYMAIAPSVPPEEMPEAGQLAEKALVAAMPEIERRWREEWLPELKATWEAWEQYDLDAATLPELFGRVEEMRALYERIWEIHFLLLVPVFIGFSEFRDMYTGLFPGCHELEPLRLLQGFDNKSLEAGRAFWGLAQRAAEQPELAALIRTTPAAEVRSALEGSEQGTQFLAEVHAVLTQFGKRADTVQEMSVPSWIEEPAPLFAVLGQYLEKADDPHRSQERASQEREAAIAEARGRLANHPPEVRGPFEGLLRAAQACSWVQEDHNYWIDQRGLHEARQVCMALGRKLAAAGKLDRADDVFLFTPGELREIADAPEGGKPTAKQRRTELDYWDGLAAPLMVGTDYGPPPDDPINRALMKFFGAPPPESGPQELRGHAGSGGKRRAVARLIMTIDEAHRLQPGEVLVAPTTSPPWTPLFGTASAIVTDTGGVLSHCAIVAREYGIPAVVGTGAATSVIKDGQMIEVDGDAGVVRLL
jgi:pyruvate,water dikinase